MTSKKSNLYQGRALKYLTTAHNLPCLTSKLGVPDWTSNHNNNNHKKNNKIRRKTRRSDNKLKRIGKK